MSRVLRYLLAMTFLVVTGMAFSEPADKSPVNFKVAPDSVVAGDVKVQEVPADTSGKLQKQFKQENPEYREHVFNLNTDVYEDNDSNPGVRLERVWVGTTRTLVELTGLPRKGMAYSAMMNKETLRLVQPKNSARLLHAEGVAEMKDSRGGAALVLKPEETLFLWFEPIDDIDSFSIEGIVGSE
jgi:hypothetical protein